MDINDIKHLAVERIFLVPDASEGHLGYLWCDDPAPGLDMDPSEAVEYVRKDVHDAIIKRQASSARMGMNAAKEHGSHMEAAAKRLHAECNPEALESERAANALLTEQVAKLEAHIAALKDDLEIHRAAEEAQIALRHKADEREAALAAHVERLVVAANDAVDQPRSCMMVAQWERAVKDAPASSLARRDAEQRGKALAETAKWFAGLHTSTELLSAEVVYDILMDQSRRQAEAEQ